MNELLNARPVYSDRDTARLRSFYDLVEAKYRALQALEVEEGVYSAIVVPMLLEKIPDTMRLTITRRQNYLDWALGAMRNALLVEVELREDQCLTQPARVTGPSDNRSTSSQQRVPCLQDEERTADARFVWGDTSRNNARRSRTLETVRDY